jgi:hypothetical protein
MHSRRSALFLLIPVLVACGTPSENAPPAPTTGERPAVQAAVANPLAPEAPSDLENIGGWAGVRVTVSDHELDHQQSFEVELGRPVVLGDTGLTLTAEAFLPDFVMDDGEIRNRSPEPHNPAVLVAITEEGAPDYRGWLFAAMPGIPPYPHPEYRLVLVEGIPAGSSRE